VTPALKSSAEAGAVAFKNDPTLFATKFAEAKTLLGTTVATPTVSDVSGVTVTNPPGSTSGAASASASMFTLIAAVGVFKMLQH